MITSRGLWRVFVPLSVGLMAGRAVQAQEVLHTWTNIETVSNNASITWLGDLDGDAYPDLIIGNALFSPPGMTNAGRILVVSGASGAVIRQHIGTASAFALGGCVYNAGDINGDGKQDYGTRRATPTQALIFSGADGSELLHRSPTGAVVSMVSLGDVDGDAKEEFVFGTLNGMELFQGGEVTPRLVLPAPPQAFNAGFGTSGRASNDLDGDGVRDFLLTGPGSASPTPSGPGHVFVFSGASGVLLHDLWMPDTLENIYARFGEGTAVPGDLNGDGKDDLAVGAPDGRSLVFTRGNVRFYDGVTGEVFATFYAPTQYAGSVNDWGRRIQAAGDLNGNGYPDILVEYYLNSTGRIVAIDGGTREVLLLLDPSGDTMAGDLDWNRDDFPDVFGYRSGSRVLSLHSGAPDGVHVVGTPSAPPGVVPPRIGVTGSARPGAAVKVHLSRVPPGQDATLVIGVPRFLDHHMLGGRKAGTVRWILRHARATQVRPGEGVATVEVAVPTDPTLVGEHFSTQWLVRDTSGKVQARTRELDFEILPLQ